MHSRGRITDPVDLRSQLEIAYRSKEVLAQFFRALFVAPVSNPDDVPECTDLFAWIEDACVCRFMPNMHLAAPSAPFVSALERSAVGKHTVVIREVEARKLVFGRQGAVVRVMK